MVPSDTVTRILDAAEVLFAEHGFSETSLRRITGRAEVNLAAVNYHFGSKQALIQAVFFRYLDPFSADLHQRLDALEADETGACDLEGLLDTLFTSVLEMPSEGHDLRTFMKLLGLAYSQAQRHLRDELRNRYGDIFSRFLKLLRRATRELADDERFWRLHFMLGSVIFTLSGLNTLRDIAEHDYHQRITIRELAQRLKPVALNALRAPVTEVASNAMTAQHADQVTCYPRTGTHS
ncbi:TetR/AcrR family transcriptional regulator [Kushneria marisflavi]|uniref:TetR family transcriptional regulator n=1 Tax=Kushneria marisflavi TaxID=157779 RepID=A0A240UK19_9GAMM|nr:TetR/AcrR family transcriptional regulator [Kushneria marisflavi]ART61844.1 TetR family transcriptional regulator [Kushneria marisflavi]RKD86884.1 TetR family transcriptional regulator [Kushneria marisflavi]